MLKAYFPAHEADVVRMINLVSCSTNGNQIDEDLPRFYYIPRWADRLEAMGLVGVRRTIEYNHSVKKPLFLTTTAKATTVEALEAICTPERFAIYQSGVKSVSAIDHLYDKLMHLKITTDNDYIDRQMEILQDELVQYLLEFGRIGSLPEID